MDLTGALLRIAIPRAFVVAAPGSTGIRLAVERELRLRGWAVALTPANSDILTVCGNGEAVFDEVVDRLWDQIPSPRALVRITRPDAVALQLDEARTGLCDLAALQADAGHRSNADVSNMDHGAARTAGQDVDSRDMGMAGHDMDSHDMGMAGHDTGHMDMDMDMPGGIPMADRSADRDGLTLDQLHVALGPALPYWPPGLIVRLVLQGDIVQTAESEIDAGRAGSSFWLDTEASADDRVRVREAAAADSLQRLLSVAGWRSAAATGCWLRDELLASGPGKALDPRFVRWIRRVRRSRVLRWSTNGLGQVGLDGVAGLRGDVSDRWLRWTGEIASLIDAPADHTRPAAVAWGAQRAEFARASLSLLPALLTGQEFASARLIVASFDPDLEALHAHAAGGSRG
jgi:hypothetical protein